MRRRWIVAAALVVLAAVAGSLSLADALRYASTRAPVVIRTTPIDSFDNRDPSKVRFGKLEFRGGLVLTADSPAFGGISGLHIEPDGGRFVAVTDRGSWLRGRILYRDGRPVGIADAEMAPLLGADGQPLAANGWYDAESLTEMGGDFYVGIERVHRIVRFDYRRHGLAAPGEPILVPADFKSLSSNKGLECLAAPPPRAPLAGSLIAVTEGSLDADGNLRSFLLRGGEVERFSVKRHGDFDVSDCTVLPPGDLLLLERSYSLARGVAMRIRRVPLARIKRGEVVDGEVMMEADLGYQIDNMEGIAVHRGPDGETIITLVSDDNFSAIQRSLLLQFTLVGG